MKTLNDYKKEYEEAARLIALGWASTSSRESNVTPEDLDGLTEDIARYSSIALESMVKEILDSIRLEENEKDIPQEGKFWAGRQETIDRAKGYNQAVSELNKRIEEVTS